MEFHYWHLVVLVVLVALVGWGFRVARQRMLLASAVFLVAVSGWLLYTLVLEEVHLDQEGTREALAFVAVPAVAGVGLGALWVKRIRSRRA